MTNDTNTTADYLVKATAGLECGVADAIPSKAYDAEARAFWEWALATEGWAFKEAVLSLVRTGDDSGVKALATKYLSR